MPRSKALGCSLPASAAAISTEARRAGGGDDEHGCLSTHDGCPREQRVERVGGHGGVTPAWTFLHRIWLARHQRFVDMGVAALQHDAISRDQIAGSQFDHVSRYDLVDRRRNDGPVAQNVGVDRHRALEGFGSEFGAMFLHHVEQDR